MVIEEIIYRHSITSPEKTAVISGEVIVSYRVLWNNIRHAAAYFISKGVRKGDRIIVSASKNIDFIYVYFGAHLAGCICVPIDPETNVTRLERIIDCAAPSMIIGELRNKGGHEVLPFTEIGSDKDSDVVFLKRGILPTFCLLPVPPVCPKGWFCPTPTNCPLQII